MFGANAVFGSININKWKLRMEIKSMNLLRWLGVELRMTHSHSKHVRRRWWWRGRGRGLERELAPIANEWHLHRIINSQNMREAFDSSCQRIINIFFIVPLKSHCSAGALTCESRETTIWRNFEKNSETEKNYGEKILRVDGTPRRLLFSLPPLRPRLIFSSRFYAEGSRRNSPE